MIFASHEQKYVKKVHLKLNLAQFTKQESPNFFNNNYEILSTSLV